jgi:hypothetical protein
MRFSDIPLPEIYRDSADFRFFVDWFSLCLSKIKYDTDNIIDLLDPERCPSELLWLLCDTMGFKYDDRLPASFNRLVLLYFMSMIYTRGSKNGVMLAAEVNLAQFNIKKYIEENSILEDRLEDTTIPVNSAYVTPHVDAGYIDVVYFSEEKPIDACIEYVRPLGMYCFQNAGVRVDARTKVSVDARLTNKNNIGMSIGPTHVGHYRRRDYASLQKMVNEQGQQDIEKRFPVYYRNSKYEQYPDYMIDPGLRTLFSLQLSNNEHIVKALLPETSEIIDPIFSLGHGPQSVDVVYPDNYLTIDDKPEYNLRYDRDLEEAITPDIYTVDDDRTHDVMNPRPAVNPNMGTLGDAIPMNPENTVYVMNDEEGVPKVTPI